MDLNEKIFVSEEDNIKELREKNKDGLTFVVGDTHGEQKTLEALMEKIKFDPMRDKVFLLGDYNEGGDVAALLSFISKYYSADYEKAGFHLIRGNHERELGPLYPLENLPDIIVLKRDALTFFLVHAGMVFEAFRLINDDMEKTPNKKVFAYKLDDLCTERGTRAPLRQITWSSRGLYSRTSDNRVWPSEDDLRAKNACIIHAHSPYCFFKNKDVFTYGEKSLFFSKQHMFFCEELRSFNIDSNIKGRYINGETYRGLSCICLEALCETAKEGLTREAVRAGKNFVFSAEYIPNDYEKHDGNITALLSASPAMNLITMDYNGEIILK
ncbi:MAG: metallophosphoesterase [Clostridia bacterium]|nr:metallophosphoesterase [Clostridia bacterium]